MIFVILTLLIIIIIGATGFFLWLLKKDFSLKNETYGSQVIKVRVWDSSGESEILNDNVTQHYPYREKIPIESTPESNGPVFLSNTADDPLDQSIKARSTFTGMRNPDLGQDQKRVTETLTALPATIFNNSSENDD